MSEVQINDEKKDDAVNQAGHIGSVMRSVLHLNLRRKWFDMILSGSKTEEYREIKKYYISRFCKRHPQSVISGGDLIDRHKGTNFTLLQKYDTIVFSNGYAKNRQQFKIELKRIRIDEGKKEWGAEEGKIYFVLLLGEVIK